MYTNSLSYPTSTTQCSLYVIETSPLFVSHVVNSSSSNGANVAFVIMTTGCPDVTLL